METTDTKGTKGNLLAAIETAGRTDRYELRECGHVGYDGYYSVWHQGHEQIVSKSMPFANTLYLEFLNDIVYWKGQGAVPNIFELNYIEYRDGMAVNFKL